MPLRHDEPTSVGVPVRTTHPDGDLSGGPQRVSAVLRRLSAAAGGTLLRLLHAVCSSSTAATAGAVGPVKAVAGSGRSR